MSISSWQKSTDNSFPTGTFFFPKQENLKMFFHMLILTLVKRWWTRTDKVLQSELEKCQHELDKVRPQLVLLPAKPAQGLEMC